MPYMRGYVVTVKDNDLLLENTDTKSCFKITDWEELKEAIQYSEQFDLLNMKLNRAFRKMGLQRIEEWNT